MLGFVEALYLWELYEEAAALFPLVEGVLELGKRWITFDGRLVETRAGIAAAAAGLWEKPNATSARPAKPLSRCPTDSSWPTWTGCTPGCCWTVATPAITRVPPRCLKRRWPRTATSAYPPTRQKPNTYGVRHSPSDVATLESRSPSTERCQQRCAPSKIICTGQVRHGNENRADAEIGELAIALHMINRR